MPARPVGGRRTAAASPRQSESRGSSDPDTDHDPDAAQNPSEIHCRRFNHLVPGEGEPGDQAESSHLSGHSRVQFGLTGKS